MSTCPFLSAAGRQKSADGQIQVRRCRKSRKQSHRLFGTQGTQKRARTETFPGLALVVLWKLHEIRKKSSLWTGSLSGEKNSKEREGNGGANSPLDQRPVHRLEKKWIDLQKENCLSWKGNLMFNNMQVFSVRWKEEEKGRGYGITAVFFHPRRRPT